jgi:hypothetical protein
MAAIDLHLFQHGKTNAEPALDFMIRNPLYMKSCPASEDHPGWSPVTLAPPSAYDNVPPDGHMLAGDATMSSDAAGLLPDAYGNVAASQTSRAPFYDMAQPTLLGGEGGRPVYDVAQPSLPGQSMSERSRYDVAQPMGECARYDVAQPPTLSREGERARYDVAQPTRLSERESIAYDATQPALSTHHEQYYDLADAELQV